MALPSVYLARHGETAWSISGQHTGKTDLPLTERGQRNGAGWRSRLAGHTFARVLCSPLIRAANLRASRFWHGGPDRLRSGRMGLWRVRRAHDRRDSAPAAPVAIVSRRLSGRRVGRTTSAAGPIAWSPACDRPKGKCSSFPAAISCGCWRRGGSRSTLRAEGCCCSRPPPSAFWVTNTHSTNQRSGCGTTVPTSSTDGVPAFDHPGTPSTQP